MGIYDREYYRSSGRGFLDSITSTGQVCKWLIILNVAAFVVQLLTRVARPGGFLPGFFADAFILNTKLVMQGQVWRLLTYAFLHSDIWHILFNMLFLWWFGRELESIYGSREFLIFYLVAAVLGGIAFTAFAGYISLSNSFPPGLDTLHCLGASGAVIAVMLVFACHFPNREILLFFLIPMRIWLVVAFTIVVDTITFAQTVNNPFGTTTAVTVHLAGAAFGFLYFRNSWNLSSLFKRSPSARRRRRAPKLRVWQEEDEHPEPIVVGPPERKVDEQLEAKLDAILAKIQSHGKESLSKSEQDLLLRASEVYKQRRSSEESFQE